MRKVQDKFPYWLYKSYVCLLFKRKRHNPEICTIFYLKDNDMGILLWQNPEICTIFYLKDNDMGILLWQNQN